LRSDLVRSFNELVGAILNHKGAELLAKKGSIDALIAQIADVTAH
jgi:hypothetical protein